MTVRTYFRDASSPDGLGMFEVDPMDVRVARATVTEHFGAGNVPPLFAVVPAPAPAEPVHLGEGI